MRSPPLCPSSCWLRNGDSWRHMFREEEKDGHCPERETKFIDMPWRRGTERMDVSLALSLSLSSRLLGAAVQLNQQQSPHQSIIISLSSRFPPATPPPWWTGFLCGMWDGRCLVVWCLWAGGGGRRQRRRADGYWLYWECSDVVGEEQMCAASGNF